MTNSQNNSSVTVSDAAARAAALEPNRSFIVQAPAGSGKTGLLVYRILRLLAICDQPESVLAITFTRKATIEMRDRLLGLMRRAENSDAAKDEFDEQGLKLASAVLEQDRRMGWNLLDTPRRLQLQTIDALSLKLVSAMPWLSRLGAQPSASDQASDLYDAAIEQFLVDELTGDTTDPQVQLIFGELDFNYHRMRTLFSAMLGKRDQWLRHLVSNSIVEMRPDLESAWQSVIDHQVEQITSSLGPQTLQRLSDLAHFAWENLVSEDRVPLPLADLNSVEDDPLSLCRMIEFMLFTRDATPKLRSSLTVAMGFPPGTNTEKAELKSIIAELQDDEALLDTIFEIRKIPNRSFSDNEWLRLEALETVLKRLAAYLQLQFRARGKSDHSEVTQRANMALRELEGPSDLALKLDYQINHILVDEFQDTSFSQIELLKRLTLGWSSVNDMGAKTLFLVGDPMQSIYRFREAEVGLFLDVWNNQQTHVFPDLNIEPLLLSQNFRSSGALVQWFNQTFSQSFPPRSNSLTGAVSYAPATTSRPASTDNAVDYLLATDAESEARLVLRAVESAIRSHGQGQIAILVRSRSHLRLLLPLLRQANIPYQGLDLLPLSLEPAVIDVVSLARALARRDDRIAWLSLLRGPWVGLSLRQLQTLIPDAHMPVFEQLQGCDETQLTENEIRRLDRFRQVLQRALHQQQQTDLSVLTQWTWQQLGGEHTRFGLSLNSIESVFELIGEHQSGGELISLTRLQAALEQRFALPDLQAESTRVVISTMHKSKGLEFDTVILPSLAQPPKADDKSLLMWAEWQPAQSVGTAQSKLLLAPISMVEKSPHYDYLTHLRKQRSDNERSRMMYVAATRAERKLILTANLSLDEETGEPKPPARNQLLNEIWNTHKDQFQFETSELGAARAGAALAGAAIPQSPLVRLPDDFRLPKVTDVAWHSQLPKMVRNRANEPLSNDEQDLDLEYEWAGPVAIAVGTLLHEWMEGLSFEQLVMLPDEIDFNHPLPTSWRNTLKAQGFVEDALRFAMQRLLKAIRQMRSDPLSEFVFKSRPSTRTELAVSAYVDNALRQFSIDRTFVDDGTLWIIDHKTTDTRRADVETFVAEQIETRHRKQLEGYGRLMSEIDGRPIQLAVYFPLLKQLCSWPFEV